MNIYKLETPLQLKRIELAAAHHTVVSTLPTEMIK